MFKINTESTKPKAITNADDSVQPKDLLCNILPMYIVFLCYNFFSVENFQIAAMQEISLCYEHDIQRSIKNFEPAKIS